MNVQVLVDSVVRQVTVLIAQLATAGGVRAPLAQIANQVFLQLARELDAQGVSRKVSADMLLGQLAKLASEQGLDELVWVLIYREGPVALAELAARYGRREDELGASLDSLTADGRVQQVVTYIGQCILERDREYGRDDDQS